MRKVFLLFAVFLLLFAACENPFMTQILGLPENLSAAERWYTWAETESGAEITHSVNADGVCTITVLKSADPIDNSIEKWKATANYLYTAKANTRYKYVFEAWTAGENNPRKLDIVYYNAYDGDGKTLDFRDYEGFQINNTRTTYTEIGAKIPKDRKRPNQWGSLEFHCADQTGTFYVKILSITPY